MSHRQRGQSAGREVVRVGKLERTLTNFMLEMGQRFAGTLAEYDRLQLEPLRQRLAALEAKPKRGRPRKTVVAQRAPEPTPEPPATEGDVSRPEVGA